MHWSKFCGLNEEYIKSSFFTFRLEHKGSRVIHSLSPHPTEPLLLSASLGQIWLWGKQMDELETVD